MIQLQAHRGVCTEYPENTMSAFRGAIAQGYPIIELDPAVTSDGIFVILHDQTINRTARRQDGSIVEEAVKIGDITYEEASGYDYGAWFSPKFAGEKLPQLEDVLQLAKENGVRLKLDNKIWNFSQKDLDNLWELLRGYADLLGITCNTLSAVSRVVSVLPDVEIHYDGEVNEEILRELDSLTEHPIVWLPFETEGTSWVRVPFASEELCRLVKKYARLGIWIVNRYEDYDEICQRFAPDIVETPGQIKPVMHAGSRVDTHTHSEHSHDSHCRIRDMACRQQAEGMYGFAVTDHCDVLVCEQAEVGENIRASVEQVKAIRDEVDTQTIRIFSGIEIGEGIYYPHIAGQILQMYDYDVIIASVHIIKYKQYNMAYSRIDFSAMNQDEIYGYLDMYYDEVLRTLQTIPCDIAAHLNCPLRYINGKYGCGIDHKRFEKKLREILQLMIQYGIALEINTSCMEAYGVDWLEQDWLLGIYRQMGGMLVTLGSDAHICENAAREFDRAIQLLKKHGFRNCFYYKKRQSIQCTIK